MRWRTEKEVMDGKGEVAFSYSVSTRFNHSFFLGQFICGDKRCNESRDLTSWEVNFAYMEDGQKKNALVKLSKSCRLSLVIVC